MRAIGRRLCRLEDRFAPQDRPRDRIRMVVRTFGPEEGLQNATCQRTICANGCLAEVVRLKGSGDGLTDEELEEFIASFPMEAVGNRVPHS